MFLQLPLDFACCGVVAGHMKGLVLVYTVDLAPQPRRSFLPPAFGYNLQPARVSSSVSHPAGYDTRVYSSRRTTAGAKSFLNWVLNGVAPALAIWTDPLRFAIPNPLPDYVRRFPK